VVMVVVFLALLIVLHVLANRAVMEDLGGHREGIPTWIAVHEDGPDYGWEVEVAYGARGQAGWTTYKLRGQGQAAFEVIADAVTAQRWLLFETRPPTIEDHLLYGIVGVVDTVSTSDGDSFLEKQTEHLTGTDVGRR
jgi:hypothetical protein